jgi:hypothetical protein
MIVSVQRIGVNNQIQNDGYYADKIDEHGDSAEEIPEGQGAEQVKAEKVEKKEESKSESIVIVFEIQAKSGDEQGNDQAEGIFGSGFTVDLFFLDCLGFKKNRVLDQKQLITIIAQGVSLFDRLFFDYFRAFITEGALA